MSINAETPAVPIPANATVKGAVADEIFPNVSPTLFNFLDNSSKGICFNCFSISANSLFAVSKARSVCPTSRCSLLNED